MAGLLPGIYELRCSLIGGVVSSYTNNTSDIRVALEIGLRGKRVVSVAPDWPGLERGATTAEAAIERLLSYVPRYAPVAELAGMESEFATDTTGSGVESTVDVDVVERYPGTG